MINDEDHYLKKATLIHYVDDLKTIYSINREIHVFEGNNAKISFKLPFIFPRDVHLNQRVIERLTRADKCLIFPVNDSLIIIRGGNIYRWNKSLEILGRLKGDCPLHNSSAKSSTGNHYVGEYFLNKNRERVNIFQITNNATDINVIYSFSAGEIRHIHGIFRDPFMANRLWVTVGDENGECFIFYSDDEFETIHRIGDGTQIWRAVTLFFTDNYICWGTDSPYIQNHFVRMDRQTSKLEIGQKVPGTIWYGGTTTDGVHFASSAVEKGDFITESHAIVWKSMDGWNWEISKKFKKDLFPMPLFKWGTISFPGGSYHSDNVWISGEALIGLDGKSERIDLSIS